MIRKSLLFFLGLFSTVVNAFFSVYIALILKRIVDTSSSGNTEDLFISIRIAVFYIILSTFISYLSTLIQNTIIKSNMTRIKKDVFNNTMYSEKNELDSASVISLLNNEMNLLENDYYRNIFSIIYSISTAVIALGYMLYLSVWLTIVVIVSSLLPILVAAATGKIFSKTRLIYTNSLVDYVRSIKEYILGIETIKSFRIVDNVIGKYDITNKNVEEKRFRFNNLTAIMGSVNGMLGSLVFISIMSVGTYLVIIGQVTLGTMIAAVQLTNNLASPIMKVSNNVNKLNSLKGVVSKIKSIINSNDKLKYTEEQEKSTSVVFNENISLKELNFTYKNNKIFDNVNYVFRKGKKYLLVGDSGCGKSTLLKLILRALKPTKGEILVDNTNINVFDNESISRIMSMIHQDIFLFNTSLYENIALFSDYEDAEIKVALKKVKLEKYIDNLKIEIKEGGANLSGGEKQRIAIARSILRHTPILLIDEMTSSLDPKTATEVEKMILDLRETTCIMVSHRVSSELLAKVDVVLRIVDKKIVVVPKDSFVAG